MNKILDILYHITIAIVAFIIIYVSLRLFVFETFIIKGHSMEPVLHDGERVLVNKLPLGARLYAKPDFASAGVKCFRMPRLGRLKPGDIAVFNSPDGWGEGQIGFRRDYLYAKRCIGCPGDRICINNGFFVNESRNGEILGNEDMQKQLRNTDDSTLLNEGIVLKAFKYKNTKWTIKSFGPLQVPQRGLELCLDSISVKLYSAIIEYETGHKASTGSYTFKENYYFFAGDNVFDSRDSRYFGLVPEKFIIGKVRGNPPGPCI